MRLKKKLPEYTVGMKASTISTIIMDDNIEIPEKSVNWFTKWSDQIKWNQSIKELSVPPCLLQLSSHMEPTHMSVSRWLYRKMVALKRLKFYDLPQNGPS